MKLTDRLFNFAVSAELAHHNNAYRAFYGPADEPARDMLPGLAVNSFVAAYEAPDAAEGFAELRTVNFVWDGSDEQKAKWMRYMD